MATSLLKRAIGGETVERRYPFDWITTPDEIRKHLARGAESNLHIDVSLEDHAIKFSSIMVGFRRGDYDSMLIDTLIPMTGNRYIRESRNITVSYKIEGAEYIFRSRYLGKVMEQGFESLLITIPEVIERHQKRSAFRVSPPASDPITIHIREDWTEDLVDISVTGVSFFTSRDKSELPVGTVLDEVRFILPFSNYDVRTSAVVRMFKENKAGVLTSGRNIVGLEFVNIPMGAGDKVSEYIMERQREIIRRSRERL